MLSNFAAVDLFAMPSLTNGEARAHRVPCVLATDQTLRGYGRIVRDFAADRVTIVTWPQPGRRPIVPGTGNEGGIVEDSFVMERRGEVQYAVNRAVGRSYITGWFTDPASASEDRQPTNTSRIYTHEANYHPDGGQIFAPRDGGVLTPGVYAVSIGWTDEVGSHAGTWYVELRPGPVAPITGLDG